MERHARRVPGGGIAWERAVFTRSGSLPPGLLVDAAVDIAWDRLFPHAAETPRLEIATQGRLLVMRLGVKRFDPELPLVAA